MIQGKLKMTKLTLFLVDDYLLTRVANKRQINLKSDFKILGDFKRAKDCLKALKIMHPDIILTDINLSDINGIELCRIIKEKYPDIKVIILSATEDDFKILSCLSSGASGYIVKGKTDIVKAIEIVSKGIFFIDLDIASSAFSRIPALNTKNMEKLYKYKELAQNLTQRELEVLELVTEGKTNSQIAHDIFVSTNTAKAHVGSILEKFGVKDRVQAAVMAVRANLF